MSEAEMGDLEKLRALAEKATKRGQAPFAFRDQTDALRAFQAACHPAAILDLIARVPVWKLIETAPKDGTHVLVGKAGTPLMRAYFVDGVWWAHLRGPTSREPLDLAGSWGPTHWQPLPPSPVSTS